MTERTDALIGDLARGLRPVRRLPSLRAVAARVAGVGLALAAAHVVFAVVAKEAFPKPGFGLLDACTIGAHALLAAGALAFALGACVPGRERLARSGVLVLAVGLAAIAGIGLARLASWPGGATLDPTWLERTLGCSLGCVLPAVVPALLLARFAARAAPRRASPVLLVGGAASLALLSAPGVAGCGYPDELHHTLAHALIPVLGAAVLWLAVLPLYLGSRPRSAV